MYLDKNLKKFEGKHIIVHVLNSHFYYQAVMLLEHFDIPEFQDYVINVGDYFYPEAITNFKKTYPNKKIVAYQLEQLVARNEWWDYNFVIENIRSADEIWDYDPLNVTVLKNKNIEVSRIVPMLYTKALEQLKSKDNPGIDVLFYGTGNDKRLKMLQSMQFKNWMDLNIVWSVGPNDNDDLIASSKVILNLHAFDSENRQEQTRIFYPVINGKTVVSETSMLNNMQGCVIEMQANEIPLHIKHIVKNDIWKCYGLAAKSKFISMTEKYMYDFRNSLKV